MKKITALAASAALALSGGAIVMPGAAAAQGATQQVEVCQQMVSLQLYSSVGQCVSIFRANPSAYPAKACKRLDDQGFLGFIGAVNRGDCVQILRQLFGN